MSAPVHDLPAGYRRWPQYWFKCPSCGHESITAIATVPVPHNLKTLYRFWCRNCGGHAVLKHPKRKGWAVLGTLGSVSLAFAAFMPNWVACGIAVSITGPVAWSALNWLTNEYVPD
jgi:predicted RNA-binding Zn-ribbon protein involved in translation (DUF1610 family)